MINSKHPSIPAAMDPAQHRVRGEGVPCGEYLFNLTNGSMLRDWLVNDFLLGPTGLGNPAIDGFFIDDGWTNYSVPLLESSETHGVSVPPDGYCDHWIIGGTTEEEFHCVEDMGLNQFNTTTIIDNCKLAMQPCRRCAASQPCLGLVHVHNCYGAYC
jgi:hypothetical protein